MTYLHKGSVGHGRAPKRIPKETPLGTSNGLNRTPKGGKRNPEGHQMTPEEPPEDSKRTPKVIRPKAKNAACRDVQRSR